MAEHRKSPAGDREAFFRQPIEPDPVIEAYKKDIDRTLIRENLKLTPEERLRKLMELQRFAEELREAGRRLRRQRR
ncbi:MAG: hypothetical protein ACRDJE_01580 [Dehalococcoidia bacterium]